MPNLAETIAQLASKRAAAQAGRTSPGAGRLIGMEDFGSNPGALEAKVYIPAGLGDGAALVVVLHGCTQTAAGYDIGSGWSEMADRHGFAVLFPQQRRQNNPNLCFNWFSPTDSKRGSGEALSIRQMIATIAERRAIDPARIFVTGLSAGGAMTSIMLATYPEVFAGGAIVAGIAFSCASSVSAAFDRMRGQGLPGEGKLSALVRKASDHAGPWPTISIWHGSADTTVSPANAEAIVHQWRSLHGVAAEEPDRTEIVDGYPHRVWSNDRGRAVIEAYTITGMGHGTPLDTKAADGCGQPGPYMLEAGISSTQRICRFWGLTEQTSGREAGRTSAAAKPARPNSAPSAWPHDIAPAISPISPARKAGKAIEDALRAAWLLP